MSTVSKSKSESSSMDRPLNLRMRSDLIAERQRYQGRDFWIIKDPISLRYFRFEEEEYTLLKMLDGGRSPEQIKRQFDFDYAPQKITMQELYQFIGMLYRSCLLVSDAAGQGTELKKRGDQRASQSFKSSLSNVLAIRFRGFDPDWILGCLDARLGWLFSWPALFVAMCLWFAAAALLFTHFDVFLTKLPGFHEFFAAKNWIWLALVMAVTKVIHEFGHGIACKRFGGQCHEMGVMLLVMTPCLYCNVSDSWTLPDKWKRATIAMAGMYVEFILAAVAVFVWWFSQPGIINQLALNLIFVSSVSTILFNANPLLRYDGYYILSDLLEIPNLRQKATTILQRTMASWTMGIEARTDPFLPTRKKWLFVLYSISAAGYRWLITFSIFWFLYNMLEPYGAKVIGQLLALFAIWGLLGMPLMQAYRFFSVPGRFGTVKRGRAVLSMALLSLVVFGVLMIPLPFYVRCPMIIQPLQSESVYIEVPGRLKNVYVGLWQRLEKNQPILELENSELDDQVELLRKKVLESQSEFDTLRRASQTMHRDQELSSQLAIAFTTMESAKADLSQREKDLELLKVNASCAGYLAPPDYIPKNNAEEGKLSSWYGYPTEDRNVGCYLDQSTVIGKVIADKTQMEAVLVVDQADIEFVSTGQEVELFLNSASWETVKAVVANVSTAKMKSVPKGLSSRFGGQVISSQNKDGVDAPNSATFQVSVPFEDPSTSYVQGTTGRAKIRSGSRTIGNRLWRLLQQTFRFEL